VTRFAVFAARAQYGGMFTETADGKTPFTQRFYYGGQNDQRGYGALQQGPKLGASPCDPTNPDQFAKGCTTNYATQTTSLGGTSAVLLSGEFRIRTNWPLNNFGIVPFVDASTIGNTPSQPLKDGLEVALGLGLRYLTPFGPVRLDVGYLINPKDVKTQTPDVVNGVPTVAPTDVKVHCPPGLAYGCVEQSRWALHVTLGEAF
jgi:outer membrane protein assembly factor BamA